MESKIALVTGAAGGIGVAVTRILGERGVTVAAVDRDKVRLDETVKKSRADGLDIWGAVVNRMVPRSRGAIVTVASNAASTARMEMAAYAASKAAATMFTKCLGLEVAKHRIRCNVVAPGSTDTPMLSSMWHDESGPKGTIEGQPDAFRVGIPLGKIARPSDIANAVTFLLSDQAAHITMHTLTVDGGAALGV